MKTILVATFLGLSAVVVGCGQADTTDAASVESPLVSITRLDRVKPAEVAAEYAAHLEPSLKSCIRGNPNIVNVDRSNLDAFYRPGVQSHYDVREALDKMLSEEGVTSIPVATLSTGIASWAERALSRSVDVEGYYVAPHDGGLIFYSAEMKVREDKALSLAALPGGKPLREIREQWREVQTVQGNLDSAWLNPVKVGSEPSLGDVKKAMGVRYSASFASWGDQAIDDFYTAHEGPAEAAEFDPIRDFLKGPSIKKRWYFQDGGNEWSSNTLVVLDEHGQLWGMQMGYSE